MADDFADIENNPFHRIILNDKLDASAKLDASIKDISFNPAASRDQNLSRLRDFQRFKDYMRSERMRIAKEITRQIPSSDTKDTLDSLKNTVNGFQGIYAILAKAARTAQEWMDGTSSSNAARDDYKKYIEQIMSGTMDTYAQLSANTVRLAQASDDLRDRKTETALTRLMTMLDEDAHIEPDTPFTDLDLALDKPLTLSRRPLRFKAPAMA
jgi:hypothetical protein